MKKRVALAGIVIIAMVLSSTGTVFAKEWEYKPAVKDFYFDASSMELHAMINYQKRNLNWACEK